MGFQRLLAKYTRRGSDLDTYWFIPDRAYSIISSKPVPVCHAAQPDIHRRFHGMPEYFAGLLSANPAHSADKFQQASTTTTGRTQAAIVYVNSSDGRSGEH